MMSTTSAPAKQPGLRQYLVVRIVGVLVALLILTGLVAWLVIVRPAQVQRAGAEVALASQQVAVDLGNLATSAAELQSAVRDWERAGLLQPAQPLQAARLLLPLLQARPAVRQASWSDGLGRRFIVERMAGGWLLRNLLPGASTPEMRWELNARGEVVSENLATPETDVPAAPARMPPSAAATDATMQWSEPRPGVAGGPPVVDAVLQWESRESGTALFKLELSLSDLSRARLWTNQAYVAVLDAQRRLAVLQHGDAVDLAEPRQPQWLAGPAQAGLPALPRVMESADPARYQASDAPQVFMEGGTRWVPHLRPVVLGGRSWTVIGLANADHYSLATRGEWSAIAAAMLAFVLLASLAGARMAGGLARLTRTLSERSTRIGNLQLEPQPPLRTAVSEIREFIDAQDRMRALLLDATQELESKVASRTADLADRESFMRTLSESSPSGLAVVKEGGQVSYTNTRWRQMFGYTASEATALHASECYADGAPGRDHVLSLLDEDGQVRDLPTVFRRKDGTVFQGLLTTTAITLDGRRAFATWLTDITPQQEASEHAQRMADEKELLLQHLQVGVAYTRGGLIVHANAKLAEFFGYRDARDMAGRSLRALVRDDAVFADLEQRALPRLVSGEVFSHEWQAQRLDGSHFEVQVRAQSITAPSADSPGSALWMVDDITERKSERRALEETARYNEVLFQESHWAIVVLDPRTERISDCNSAAVRIYGYTARDEVLGRSPLEFSAPFQADGTASTAAMEALRRDGRGLSSSLAFEWRHRRPDGTEWDAVVHSMPLRIGGRHLTQFTLDDVTIKRGAQRRVGELNAFLQAMLDQMPNAVFYKGADTRLLGCNRRFEEMFGVPRAAFLGKRLDEMNIAPAEMLRAFQQEDEQLIAKAGHVQREMRLRFASGKTHYTLYSASGFHKQDGTPGGLVGVIVDIDPLRRAERALSEAGAEQLAIFESASMGICLVQGSVIRRCNRRLEEIFGYADGELAGQSTRIWYASDAAFLQGRALVHSSLGTAQAYRHDLQMQRKDGSQFWCRLSGSWIDAQDPQRGSVWMLEDVTDEIEAAQALREAKCLADEATRAKSMFLANMSHEIRTPLNSIIGMSYLTLRTQLDERQRDYITKVHSAGTALLAIINDLLDFSRVDAGKLQLERTAFRFDDVLDNITSQVAQKAYDKGLELFFDTPRDIPPDLIGDPLRLGQVVAHLADNAVKFTEQGQISVAVRVLARTADAVELQIAVRDTGIGMSDEQTHKLFQVFTQADGSNTRRHGGTGLGLSLSKRLVEMMGGTIKVESAPGQGSLFWFTVQLGLGVPTTASPRLAPGLFTGMQALVADDNETLREILGTQLADLGFEVQTVDSGQRAIEALRARAANRDHRPFDVFLVDWKMPGIDGIETARRVREAGLDLHIVMATAYGGQQDIRQRAAAAGVDVFLVKPVSQSSLIDALVRAFVPTGASGAPVVDTSSAAGPLLGLRLLVADDNENDLQSLCAVLRQAGALVDAVHNGLQAVERAVDARDCDAILLDLHMPVLDGIEATTRIRTDARLATVPIIGMASESDAEGRRQALAAGITDHVDKPVEAAQLLDTLRRCLQPRPRPAAIPPRADPAMLHDFAQAHAEAASKVAAALAAGEPDAALRITQSLRDAATRVRLAAVDEGARELEEALQSGADPSAALDYVRAVLTQTLRGFPRQSPPGFTHAVDAGGGGASGEDAGESASARSEHVDRMKALLAAGDAEAVDHFQAHAGTWRTLFSSAGLDRFERSLQEFDFDQGLQQLQSALAASDDKVA